jgi:hypothetical protein
MSRIAAGAAVGFALATAAAEPPPADAATRRATDREAGVRFVLENRRLTVRLLARAPRRVRRAVQGNRVKVVCTRYAPIVTVTDTRRWRSGARRARFRFGRDISRDAAWCLIEHRRGGDIAFVNFSS